MTTPFRPIIIAPSYNNATTLPTVLADLAQTGHPILVVNDGSTDQTATFLATWQAGQVLTHPTNLGKAAALLTGFAAARAAGFTHALTIDTDGQHDVRQVPLLLAAAQEKPDALILGTRDHQTAGYPARSRLGRTISNSLVRLESGLRVSDSQCGFRVYPLVPVSALHCAAGHYGFETEILTRWGWAGREVTQVPVACVYFPPDRGVSHFRPGLDSLRAVAMHARLGTLATLRALSPKRAWAELRTQGGAPAIASGLAIGAFIACLPFFGIQGLLGLVVARWFKLNPLSVLAGSQISFGPVAPVVIVASAMLGHLLLHGSLPHIVSWHSTTTPFFARTFLLEWAIGSPILGIAMAVAMYILARALFRFTQPT